MDKFYQIDIFKITIFKKGRRTVEEFKIYEKS
jgi:hypothetical protein